MIASFFAPRPDHKFYQDYTPYLMLLDLSCQRFGHKHIVLTDTDLPFETFKTELPHNLMQATIKAQLDYLKSTDDSVIFVGADCVLAADPYTAFDLPFDVAFTTGPFSDCILNTGAIFVRNGRKAAHIWEQALNVCGVEWGDDQLSLASVVEPTLDHGIYERCGLKVGFFDVEHWNQAPIDVDTKHPARILHFRGPRKEWMQEYCAKWLDLGTRPDVTVFTNVPDETLLNNIRINTARGLREVEPDSMSGTALIVGGGPSLKRDLILIKNFPGTIYALNGAARYLSENGVHVHNQIVMDSRPENARFLGYADHTFLASQCDPSLFDHQSGPVTIFHPMIEGITVHLMIGGGISSGLTAMCLVHTLGHRRIHLFGYDSSDDGEAHAYPQDENEKEKKRIDVICGGQKFTSSLTMYKQAEEFPKVATMLANDGSEIIVHGYGLLPTIARHMQQEIVNA